MKKVSVKEYSEITGINERTVRRYILTGKLPTSKEVVNNRQITMIIVDDNFLDSPDMARREKEDYTDSPDSYQDVEVIKENSTSLVTMNDTIFEQLINNIKALADDRAQADRESYKKLEEAYFELKGQLSGQQEKVEKIKENYQEKIEKLQEELLQEKLKAAQAETEIKLTELRIKELEEKINQQPKVSEGSIWFKKL